MVIGFRFVGCGWSGRRGLFRVVGLQGGRWEGESRWDADKPGGWVGAAVDRGRRGGKGGAVAEPLTPHRGDPTRGRDGGR